jgi:hypothetical protein
MRARPIMSAALLAAFFFCGYTSLATGSSRSIGLILHDDVKLYAARSFHSEVLAVLVQQTQVEILSRGHTWDFVRIWASVTGWVLDKEVDGHRPWESTSHYRAPEIHSHVHASAPQVLSTGAVTTTPVTLLSEPGGKAMATVPKGTTLRISGWRQDATGGIWYRIGGSVSSPAVRWAAGDAIRFMFPDPANSRVHGQLIWKRAIGKGMWLTLGVISDSNPDAVVRAAALNGITHLYLESAISPLGFHGKASVGHLIDAAHRHHISAIAWVYPYLFDIASDVALTLQVASYRTLSGQPFDGIAADLEQNVSPGAIRAYSQLVRAEVGPGYLLVGVTYPPQSFPGYPFAEVGDDYNVVAPMDYWHQTKTDHGLDNNHQRYGYDYSYQYAAESIRLIRRRHVHVPISPIGQVFDNFGRLEMGPYAPSAEEITGFLRGCKAQRAVGASFFQWMTATDDEWRAIQSFRY